MKAFSPCILILVFVISVAAQHRTAVTVASMEDKALQAKIAENTSAILTNFNIGFKKNCAVSFDNIGIGRIDIVAVQIHLSLDPDPELIAAPVHRPDGTYEIRDIPLTIKLENDSIHFEEEDFCCGNRSFGIDIG